MKKRKLIRIMYVVTPVMLVLLLALMALVTFSDVWKLIH